MGIAWYAAVHWPLRYLPWFALDAGAWLAYAPPPTMEVAGALAAIPRIKKAPQSFLCGAFSFLG